MDVKCAQSRANGAERQRDILIKKNQRFSYALEEIALLKRSPKAAAIALKALQSIDVSRATHD